MAAKTLSNNSLVLSIIYFCSLTIFTHGVSETSNQFI